MTTELDIPTHKDCMKIYLFICKERYGIKICINIIIHIYNGHTKKKSEMSKWNSKK